MTAPPAHVRIAQRLLEVARDDVYGNEMFGHDATIDVRLNHQLSADDITDFEKACDAMEESVLRITSRVRQAVEIAQIG